MISNLLNHLPEDILIIDDGLDSLQTLMLILRQGGYTVRGASSLVSALRMIAAAPPELILLDSQISKMDGDEVCRRLKANEKTAVIPIIFIGTTDSPDDKKRWFAAGGADYITKPFQVEEVLVRVKTQLSLRQLQEHLKIQNKRLQHEIAERHHAEAALQKLEKRIDKRTDALTLANTRLTVEAVRHERVQTARKRSKRQYRTLFVTLPVDTTVVGENRRTSTINSALAQKAQHESDEKFRTIVANTEAILFMIDQDGLFTLSEGKGLASLGLKPGQVVGISAYELYKGFPDIIQGITDALNGKATHGTINVGDVWFDIWYSPYWDADGGVLGTLGMAVDITKHKQVEDELMRHAAQLRQLSRAVEQSPETIVITDLDGRIEYVNPQFSKTTGYSFDEVRGKNPRILKSSHTTSEEYQILWEAIKNGREWRGEFHNRRKDGELYWESAAISPITDNNNVITHYLAMKEDITARKRMESALQRRNDELTFINRVSHAIISCLDTAQILCLLLEEIRAFWNVSAGMIWMVEESSGDLVCTQVTEPYKEQGTRWRLPAGRSLLGWVQREKKGLIVDDAPQDPRFNNIEQNNLPLRALLAVPLQSNSTTIGVLQFVDEQIGRFTETDLKLVESLAATAVNTIENARLHQNLQTQFQKLKSTQAQLIQSEKLAAIGELISGIAHELNNPLASIILYAGLMEARGVDDKVRRDLKQIVIQSHRASNVVHGLLDFARQRSSERTPTQVNDVLKRTVDLLAYELRTHNIKVETNFSTTMPIILADGHQLQQVFVNLINNALQAMNNEKGGKVTLTTKYCMSRLMEPDSKKTILIIIQDDGPGIAQESASHIFDPFFTTKAAGKGTGLGLAVCRGIITNHQGEIWMESELGRGAAFFIELPIIAPEEELVTDVVEKTAVSPDTYTATEKRILVVDDEASILMIITRILRRRGFAVDSAESGAAALERLQQNSYDLIVSDLRMPEMSGQTFYRQATEKYPEYNGRFIFTTGDAITPDLRSFLKENNAPALEKPFEMEELIHMATQVIIQGER